MTSDIMIPASVRYAKNGAGGRWWPEALANSELHAGWQEVPSEVLAAGDYRAAESHVRGWHEANGKGGGDATRSLTALRLLLDHPSEHVWITFEQGRLWWCTVHDDVHVNANGESLARGHFWLKCRTPWNDRSLDGQRLLTMGDLPGVVTTVAGFRGTVCQPDASEAILRTIKNERNPLVETAQENRAAYVHAIAALVGQLRHRDFEVLIDLILSRDGWARIGSIGGARADVDIEVENRTTEETGFVQIKSAASQATLDEYIGRFRSQADRYDRMIFAVHTPSGPLDAQDSRVKIWTRPKIAELVVRLGLGDWLERRV